MHGGAGAQVGQGGAADGQRIDAEVVPKAPVLHCNQALHQESGYLLEPHQNAVLAVRWIDAAEDHRLQAHQVQRRTVHRAPHRRHAILLEGYAEFAVGLRAVGKVEGTGIDAHPGTPPGVAARPRGIGQFAIAKQVQLRAQLLRAQAQPRVELQRPRVDVCRHRPTATLEVEPDLRIEVHRIGTQQHGAHQERPREHTPS